MEVPTRTNIQKFFDGKTVFVTGATGLLGSILVEKLLRSCPDVKKIYVLIRSKWGSTCQNRFEELLNMPLFDDTKTKNLKQLDKVIPLSGDLEKSNLGLSENDLELLVENVNCVFHVGAAVKFTYTLSSIMRINVLSTDEIIRMCKSFANLQSFVYVSTGYSQCTKETIDEVVYESTISSEKMILLARSLDDQTLDKLAPIILEKLHNGYTFTKSLAEDLLGRTASNLPVAIVRPTAVCSSWKEPLPGYTYNLHTVSLHIAAYALGLAHVLISKPEIFTEMIPADYVVNNVIAAAWELGTFCKTTDKSIRVYNCARSQKNSLTMRMYEGLLAKNDRTMPLNQKVWHRFVIVTNNKFLIRLLYFLQLPYMYFLDFLCTISGRPRRSVQMYRKLHTLIDLTSIFINRPYFFRIDQTTRLYDKLEENDKKLFNFDASTIDWDSVFHNVLEGIRLYIMKEDPKTIPRAQQKSFVLKILHYITLCVFLLVISYLVIKLF